nr:hypothetical protein [Tanacetum cinerariifolium]
MTLTFAETHNMIAYLSKSDASEGFNQIIDFLNGSSIKYALTVKPNIYVSCIKKFWTYVAVKKVNDVMRLQALIDKKKVVISEATIRDAFCLDDAEGIECLPNEEIFAELARMGSEKPSTKLAFYKAFFLKPVEVFDSYHTSMVGKGFSGVETPLFEGMIVAQEVADEGDAEVNVDDVPTVGVAAEGDVSAADDVVPTAVEEPFISSPTPPTPLPQPSQDQPSTSQVQLTPPHSPQAQPQSPQHQPQPSHDTGLPMDLLQNLMDICTTLTRRVENLEQDKIAQALEITKLKSRVKKLERRNKTSKLQRLKKVGTAQRIETSNDTAMDDVSKQGRMIANMNADVDFSLEDDKEVVVEKSADVDETMQDDDGELAELQEVVKVVTTANLLTEVVTAASATLTAATSQLTTAAAPTLTTAPSDARRRKGVEHKPLKKQAQIKQDEAYARELVVELNKNIDWDKVIDHVQRKQKEDNTKVQMDEEDSRALKRLNESQEDKAAKKQKLDEEVEELKRHLQIVPNEKDDVYTEATPLARKVPIVDYEIYNENNKPYYKIKRADGLHQLYLSFLSLLRNFDKEDLETLWRLVKERFATTKPKNFSDDFLLITLGAMFKKPDIQAQI